MDQTQAALIGVVVLTVNGLFELMKYTISKSSSKNSAKNGSFTPADREKLTELRIYQKQQLDETKEQTSLLTEMRDSLKLMAYEDSRSDPRP